MTRKKLATALLSLSLLAPGIYAQTTPAAPGQVSASAVDSASVQALKDMGAYLQSLQRFQISTSLTGERVLADGQKLQHTATAVINVARPKKLHVRITTSRSEREIFYDGKTAALYTPAQKYYSTVALDDTIPEFVSKLETRYRVEVPLSDLFVWGTPAAQFDSIESAMNAGQEIIGDDVCDHYVFRQGEIDWQIWIATGSAPLPRKLVITNRADEARPQSVSTIDWNLKPTFKNAAFTFTPPKGSTAVELRSPNKK